MKKSMHDLTSEFSRKCFRNFSESDSVSEECEKKLCDVSVSGFETTMTEEYLRFWFTKLVGSVKSVKVAKDGYGRSLGCCTVSFYSMQDAEKAVRTANNRELNGRILTVKSLNSVEEKTDIPEKCVFVKGFGDTLDDSELEKYFKDNIGDVEKAEVAKYEDGTSKGYGKIQFRSYQDAVKAVIQLNGVKVRGNILSVEPFKTKEQIYKEPNRNVYVNGFGDLLDNDDLKKLFEIFGEIDSAKVERDINGTSKGFGYVCFKTSHEAETAITKMNGNKLGSKILTVRAHQSREERQKELKNRNLHVRNLHESVNERELEKLFAPYGKVLSVHVNVSRHKGINQGHVCFETSKEADKAVAELNMYPYKGLKLKVAPHQTKEERCVNDSKHERSYFLNGTSQISHRKGNAYKNRSKSLESITKNVNLKVLGKLDECGKFVERMRSESASVAKTSEISATLDQNRRTCVDPGSQGDLPKNRRSPKKIGSRIAANLYQVDELPESVRSETCSPNTAVPQPAGVFSENRDNSMKETAKNLIPTSCRHITDTRQETRTGNFQSVSESEQRDASRAATYFARPHNNREKTANNLTPTSCTRITDTFQEMQTGSFHSFTESDQRDAGRAASRFASLPLHIKSHTTVTPENSSRKKSVKKAYVCGANVKKI